MDHRSSYASSYAPQSPDLSNYAPQSPDLSGYAPQSPDLAAYHPYPPEPQLLDLGVQKEQYAQQYHRSFSVSGAALGGYEPPPPPTYDPTSAYNDHFAPTFPPLTDHPTNMARTQAMKGEDAEDDGYTAAAPTASTKPARAPRKGKSEGKGPRVGGADAATAGIEVKTKFPVARIKRIMQADEDVGKVAQVTPVVVSKALELFMIALITRSAAAAKQRASKRVTAAHLKHAVLSDDRFDFLGDIVGKVADAPSASKDEADTDEAVAAEGSGGAGAKKKRAGGKRKKASEES
ncbi:hypothetical protein LTR04_005500 [Oleoguttula sp. CCFEE 6159]|nr:hypothetical protein LTR04_005500 [Oleoguttula sp. CCFEE 6159]